MNDAPRPDHIPRSDATLQGEKPTLANVYRFILDSHAKKKAAHPGGPDDVRKDQNAHTTTPSIPE